MSHQEENKNAKTGKKKAVRRRKRRHPIVSFILGVFSFICNSIGFLFTILLIGCLTGAMLVGIFMTYVNTSLKPDLYVDASQYVLEQSSIIYYMDKSTGNWTELQKLHGTENRVVVDYEEIPQYLIDAAIAIEDKRFLTHHGVDWRRTGGAVLEVVKGDKSYGGSTITQQLLKNITGDRESTIKRKVTEIFRALEFERRYTKDEIMEMYLNTVAFGQGCNGVQTAAQLYFGKDVSDLSLAECASIIGITNNPSKYGPFSTVKWTAANGKIKTAQQLNKERQELILGEMYEQEKITLQEYVNAMAEELKFANVRSVEDIENELHKEDTGNLGKQSWFVDQLRREVGAAMMEKYGVTSKEAQDMLLYGGYNIYTTLDPEVQEIAESVYEDRSNLDVTSAKGQQLQSGITIVDVNTGNVVAMVGAVGRKEGDMVFNYAMTTRQCGSSIKPLSLYAPALDAGVITPATVFDDYPVRLLNGTPWPRNSPTKYTGRTMLDRGIYNSINTVAVQTIEQLGLNNSYKFLTGNLGMTTITEQDSEQVGNLGLGGLEKGVNTMEMAAAYATFANDGIYNKPRMYVKVTDSEGRDVLVNDSETAVAMKETTAYFMNKLLGNVITKGTGKTAKFDDMSICGKTGTTNDDYDRYFVGYTPYYSAAVWTGYDKNEKISYTANRSPAIDMWRMVMEQLHEGLEDTGFHLPESGIVEVKVCQDSGMLASEACAHDLRGNRTTTVEVATGTAPTETCTMHVMTDYCSVGKCLAFPGCRDAGCVISVALLDFQRPEYYSNGVYDEETGKVVPETKKNSNGEVVEIPLTIIAATDDAYVLSRLDDAKECPTHGLGEGWSYDEEGNLIYTPPVVEEPELPWQDPEAGGEGGGFWPDGGFQEWLDNIFGGGSGSSSTPAEPTEPEGGQPADPVTPADPAAPGAGSEPTEPENSRGSVLDALLDLNIFGR